MWIGIKKQNQLANVNVLCDMVWGLMANEGIDE